MEYKLDELMKRFRVASRDLFNNSFRLPDPDFNEGWDWADRFKAVENTLYQELVLALGSLPSCKYGEANADIQVETTPLVPIMINREILSGYWDFPVEEVAEGARMQFIEFFDWAGLDYRDNAYVRVRIEHWPTRPEIKGKHALIQSQYVQFRAGPGLSEIAPTT